jgi:hypothetical protein
MVKQFPFNQKKISESVYEREFLSELASDDLLWHWDEEDRIIRPLHETDWKFQFDNELPFNISGEINIPKGVWHRLIKGTGDLRIKVKKL